MSKSKEAILDLPDLRSKPCLRTFIESLLKEFDTAESGQQLLLPQERAKRTAEGWQPVWSYMNQRSASIAHTMSGMDAALL